MTETEKKDKLLVLQNAYRQIQFNILNEESFLLAMSKRELEELRNEILDKIIQLEKELDLRKKQLKIMNKSNKIRLDALILQSQTMGTEENSLEKFAAVWHSFLNELNANDRKIAVQAYFQGIKDNLEIIKKGVEEIVQNGTEIDRQAFSNEFEKIKELLISSKVKALA